MKRAKDLREYMRAIFELALSVGGTTCKAKFEETFNGHQPMNGDDLTALLEGRWDEMPLDVFPDWHSEEKSWEEYTLQQQEEYYDWLNELKDDCMSYWNDFVEEHYQEMLIEYNSGLRWICKDNILNIYSECKEAADILFYRYLSDEERVHTDNIKALDIDIKSFGWARGNIFVMDEEEYNNTVLANASPADFAELYDDPNAKVCVIILASDNNA